jgi:protein ImuB
MQRRREKQFHCRLQGVSGDSKIVAFASIHVPNFMVQAVMRDEARTRERAMALVDGTPPLVRVVAADEAALRAGIQLGMAKLQAELCGVEVCLRSRAQEKAAHAALLDLGWSISPRIEDYALDTIIADVAGLSSLFGSDENIAQEIVRRTAGLGLLVHVAISANLETAVHAARGFPGITLIPSGEEEKCLSNLPVRALSSSLEALETLDRWGIRNCKELAALPVLELSERLGQAGVRLHELARGASVRSIVLAEPGERMEEEMELDDAVEDLEPLSFLLGRLLDQMCARLAARSLAASVIRAKFDLGDLFEKDVQVRKEDVLGNSAKGANDGDTRKSYETVLQLPVPVRESKMLLRLLRLQLQADPPAGDIVKITLAAEPARPRSAQGGLFVPGSPNPEKLELTVARLAKLVGNANIGSPELVNTNRPGEFRMTRFVPEASELGFRRRNRMARKKTAAGAAGTDGERPLRRPATGCRIFRPRVPAAVELREGCPAKVFFRGLCGRVVAASGPWRTSGDWWRENSWHQDEWDLEIEFQIAHADRGGSAGLYCIYYDSDCRGWFVRGVYD